MGGSPAKSLVVTPAKSIVSELPNPADYVEVQMTTPVKTPHSCQASTPLIDTPEVISRHQSQLRRENSFYFTPPHKKQAALLDENDSGGEFQNGGSFSQRQHENQDASLTGTSGNQKSIIGSSCRALFDEDKNRELSRGGNRQLQLNSTMNASISSNRNSPSQATKSVCRNSPLHTSKSSRSSSSLQEKNKGFRQSSGEVSTTSLAMTLHELSCKMDILLMNMARLSRLLLPGEKRMIIPKNMPKLPLDTQKELDHFEKFLADSDVNLAATVDYMSNYVRTNVVDPERKSGLAVLCKLLTNQLAKNMNLDGGHGKIAFRKLSLYKVYQGTIQTAFPKSDLTTSDDALQKWLKDAKWRKRPSAA